MAILERVAAGWEDVVGLVTVVAVWAVAVWAAEEDVVAAWVRVEEA